MKNLYIIIFLLTFFGCKKSEDGTVEVVPLAPTELKAIIVSKDQLDLTWKDNSTNETGYKIERKTDSGNFTEIGSTAADVSIFSDKTVILNTNYTYRVYSFNQVGKSIQYSNEVTIKTLNVPALTTYAIDQISSSGANSGGNVTSDGGSTITSLGIVWDTATNPTIALSTKASSTTSPSLGAFKSSMTGLKESTKYYVRAYATNSAGTGYGNELSFTTSGGIVFGTVTSATGRIWMDRNLGASRVAISNTDLEAYGDYYQWGRGADGHQLKNSPTTTILSGVDAPGNANFILAPNTPWNWHSGNYISLWQGVNGVNNPCPKGYRLPTENEWNQEIQSWGKNKNAEGAFASPLKLPMAGHRFYANGTFFEVGKSGYYWSTSVYSSGKSIWMAFASDVAAGTGFNYRAMGAPCRCIKD